MEDFDAVLRRVEQTAEDAAVEWVRDVCDDLLSESRDEVPYDMGDLSNSGKVTVVRRTAGIEGAVSFDTPYAVRQHEDPALQHQDGKKAQYLGDPLRANSQRYLDYLAAKERGAHS